MALSNCPYNITCTLMSIVRTLYRSGGSEVDSDDDDGDDEKEL